MPAWALGAMEPVLRERLDGDWGAWRKTLHADPCAYCGERGGAADHIVARRSGGRNLWCNLTGSCDACNRAKGTMSALAFVAGVRNEIRTLPVERARFGPLVVAATNLALVVGGGSATSWADSVLQALLESHPQAEGALLYRRRRQRGHPEKRWNHTLATREGGAHAGDVCGALGGGGSPRKGGVQARELLLAVLDGPDAQPTGTGRSGGRRRGSACK